ncbi:TPA: hypothetical protein ACJHQH_002857, partial [Shigella boydii]|nr:hypothetical protein [Shigella boydii]EFZ3249690.1 hypothetical protein [Shigella boydii]EFZ4178529.1 hypothetical protein [Shigella boydii]EFZ4940841.1 hypothetical protein [Shigella boydii]EFZ4991554.1 hypothetical protein [Shigella boydii]
GLAPSCSSTVVLVVGDAVALALSELKKFTRADFGLYHPGGALGIKANSYFQSINTVTGHAIFWGGVH